VEFPVWIVFAALSAAYVFAAVRNRRKNEGRLSIAATIWLKMAAILGLVAIALAILA
jgi:phosphatidylglycerophosphate synthase